MKRADFYLEVATHADKLAALMRDPHPGLMSWGNMVAKESQWIADWWDGKFGDMVTEPRPQIIADEPQVLR